MATAGHSAVLSAKRHPYVFSRMDGKRKMPADQTTVSGSLHGLWPEQPLASGLTMDCGQDNRGRQIKLDCGQQETGVVPDVVHYMRSITVWDTS